MKDIKGAILDPEPHSCACKFVDDLCVEVCCYHTDLEANNKKNRKRHKKLVAELARLHNENLALRKSQPQEGT